MGGTAQRLKVGLVVALSALALVASDAAVAGYGGGGGGGNPAPKPRKAKPAISAKVKNGDLVMKGSAGSLSVRLFPTATGLRVEGRSNTKINGGTDPVLLEGITGDWKLSFGRALAIELDIGPADPGAPRPAPANVKFTGGKRTDVVLRDTDIAGELKIDVRRSLNRRIGDFALEDVTVGGDLKMTGASDRTHLRLRDSTVTGLTSLNARVRSRSNRYSAGIDLTDSTVSSVVMKVSKGNGNLVARTSTITGSLDLRGDINVLLDTSAVGGDLSLAASFDAQSVQILRTDVNGTVSVSTGAKDDDFLFDSCTIGMLDLNGGPGNDALDTFDVTVGAGSHFDGSKGRADAWQTNGDETMIETTGVESVGPFPIP